jgi:hypothetical protein
VHRPGGGIFRFGKLTNVGCRLRCRSSVGSLGQQREETMSDALRMIRTTSCIALGFVALWTTEARAAFMVTSTCATDVTIVEGNPGSLDCTVTNSLTYPVYIQGIFGG